MIVRGVIATANPLLVRLDSGDAELPASCLASYTPVNGDRVLVDTGPPLVVLGSLGGTGWVQPVLGNGWVNYGAGFLTTYYRKAGDRGELRGTITGGTTGTVIFNLPPGFRPPAVASFVCASNNGTATVTVAANGDVVVTSYQTPGSNASVSLNQVSFSVTV